MVRARGVALEHARIDVRRARDGRRVAQVAGDLVDGVRLRALSGGLRRARDLPRDGERDRGEHRGVPRAEVLGREALARDLLDVGVDVLRAQVGPRAAPAVGEQLGTAAAPPPELEQKSCMSGSEKVRSSRVPLFAG